MVYRGQMTEVEHTQRSMEQAESRLEFETLISDLSSRFINVPPDDVDSEIEEAQRRVCEVLRVDLSALWEGTTAADSSLILTHFYSSREDLLPPMRGMSAREHFPWLQQEMLDGRIVAVSSLEELPEPAAFDRDNLRLFGVKSNLTIPLAVGGGSPVAALGFNTTRAERDWPDALVKRLQLVTEVFANALARKRADETLRESEERLALAADSAEAGLWSLDYRTGIFWVTERTRAIFGYAPDEVVDMDRLEASVHPDDRDLVRGAIERSAADGEVAVIEYRILPGDGSARWISSRGRPRSASTSEPECLMGVSIDITARKRAEEAFRASEARLEASVELAGLAFYEVDFDEGLTYVDDRFRDLCGVPSDLEHGLQAVEFWVEHLHPDDRARVMDARRRLHDGTLEEALRRVSLPASRPKAEVDSAQRPRRHARCLRTHGQDVRRAPRRHRAQARRGGLARPEPAPDRRP